jgi:hypothetical protein
MPKGNRRNLQVFEAASMRELYDIMRTWQQENHKSLLSVCIQSDRGMFCCIALTNPIQVVITDEDGEEHAIVNDGALEVSAGPY